MADSESILMEAHRIINADKQEIYGEAHASFQRIADIATIVLGRYMSAEDCALFMICFKLAREAHKHQRDNLVDLCGYAAILQNLLEGSIPVPTVSLGK